MPEAAGVAQILASCGIVSSYCWAKQLHPPENPETKKSTVPAQSSKPTGKSGYPEFSLELAVLKNVVVDDPIPGIHKLPPEAVPEIAMSMVLQDGKWYLTDRVMAEFTGETAGDVNRRAQDRNGIALVHASKSQLIEIACHLALSAKSKGGHSNQLYSRDSAISLLSSQTDARGAHSITYNYNYR